jgi:hypothetical protein
MHKIVVGTITQFMGINWITSFQKFFFMGHVTNFVSFKSFELGAYFVLNLCTLCHECDLCYSKTLLALVRLLTIRPNNTRNTLIIWLGTLALVLVCHLDFPYFALFILQALLFPFSFQIQYELCFLLSL